MRGWFEASFLVEVHRGPAFGAGFAVRGQYIAAGTTAVLGKETKNLVVADTEKPDLQARALQGGVGLGVDAQQDQQIHARRQPLCALQIPPAGATIAI